MVDASKQKHAGKSSAQRFRDAVMNALNLDMDDFETDDDATDYVLGLLNSMKDNEIAIPKAVAPSAPRSWQYEFRDVKDSNDYSELVKVLHDALTQAAYGKGRERHANDLPFHQQPMNAISDLIGSPLGLVYQVCKKVVEGVNLPTHDQRVRELLGVINYTAGIVIWLNRHQSNPPKE
ncbi:hypothetical protein HWA87_gp67 [Salmonella phage 35]|uniref:Uncharacterized protein n=1 Tax=Salmonella phage 35 TaxID=1654888 RepID=A0A0N7CGJ0_9CAUD|nr:hypothetical protein HWA87_gp67 [Salmonella phage 35]AKJ74130.1 hypothetical protein SP35_67 [Salmonella phage 35]